jgi:hypothetical protein
LEISTSRPRVAEVEHGEGVPELGFLGYARIQVVDHNDHPLAQELGIGTK